jgi:uncharacterized protein
VEHELPPLSNQDLPPESGITPEPASEFVPGFAGIPQRGLRWVFLGSEGLRSGWLVLVFLFVAVLAGMAVSGIFFKLHLVSQKQAQFTAGAAIFQELIMLLGILAGAAVVALIQRRSILDFYLRGPRRVPHFFNGLAIGFLALSLLVGVLVSGGWLHFGPIALSGAAVFRFAALWACAFLLVGCAEEGLFRCVLLSTLTRGLNFWWALGTIAVLCASVAALVKVNGIWGVLVIALLGLAPCLWLHLKRAPRSGFWQAAWVTSTIFGLIHTGNGGENWLGIFAAGAIGFVFCVSVRLTGSAWWAIGFHASWDWGETFFYGTNDSGLAAKGHYLTSAPAGNALWSGGVTGPEGSLLVPTLLVLLLVYLMLAYGRRKAFAEALLAGETVPISQ